MQDGAVIASTKTHNDGTPLEYVLGCNQVKNKLSTCCGRIQLVTLVVFDRKQICKGFERGVLHVSVGERVRITVQPSYAYGEAGLPPTIPQNTVLIFDVTLLSFRTRAIWTKPFLQSPGLTQHPYTELHEDFLSIPNATSIVSLTNEVLPMDSARSTNTRSTSRAH